MKMRIRAGLVLAAMGVAGLGTLVTADAQQRSSCAVTKAQYDRLQTGMTETEAVAVLGCRGIEMSSTDMAGYYTVMYMWNGSGVGNMNAMFQNNALISKAQFGLE